MGVVDVTRIARRMIAVFHPYGLGSFFVDDNGGKLFRGRFEIANKKNEY